MALNDPDLESLPSELPLSDVEDEGGDSDIFGDEELARPAGQADERKDEETSAPRAQVVPASNGATEAPSQSHSEHQIRLVPTAPQPKGRGRGRGRPKKEPIRLSSALVRLKQWCLGKVHRLLLVSLLHCNMLSLEIYDQLGCR